MRPETISSLGRAPARQTRPSLPPPEPPPPGPERGTVGRWLHGALFENVGLKFLSMVLAVTVFLLVNDDKDREITVRVGVLYVLPENKVLTSDRVDEVRVTLRGPWRRLQRFDERELGRITVDLRGAPTGEVAFTPDMIHAPAGLAVAGISPRTMRVTFDKRGEKLVTIEPSVAGRPQHGYVVLGLKAVPSTIKVRGAEKAFVTLGSVPTEEISVQGRTESFTSSTKVVPPDGIELMAPDLVSVHVQVDEELVTRRFPAVAIAIEGEGGDPSKWRVMPGQVEITLTGALLAVEKAKETMTVSVKVVPTDASLHAHEAEVMIDGIPPGVGVRKSPERVKLVPAAPSK